MRSPARYWSTVVPSGNIRWRFSGRISALCRRRRFSLARRFGENIAFGAPDASEDRVMRAAEAAHIRKEFEDFPRGFETMVGERGVTLPEGKSSAPALLAPSAQSTDLDS